jgi:hypothetical protein
MSAQPGVSRRQYAHRNLRRSGDRRSQSSCPSNRHRTDTNIAPSTFCSAVRRARPGPLGVTEGARPTTPRQPQRFTPLLPEGASVAAAPPMRSVVRRLLATSGATCSASRPDPPVGRVIGGGRDRLPPSELWFQAVGVSLQDECDRQFVSVERIAKIGEGHHQHLDFVHELPEPGCGAAP